jgi:hypothetical protein
MSACCVKERFPAPHAADDLELLLLLFVYGSLSTGYGAE